MLAVRILRTIGLLAALLSAAWAVWYFGFRLPEWENARGAACQSNLKQIALGVLMYTQDYDDTFPTAPHFHGLAEQVYPYVKNQSMYHCPTATQVELGRMLYGYGWNHHYAGKRFSTLGAVADEPMLFDREPWHRGTRNAIRLQGWRAEIYMTRESVPQAQLSPTELRRYACPSYRTNVRLRRAFRWHRWRTADRLYEQALAQAGDNPTVAPQLYEERIAVQCKLNRLDEAEQTWQEMKLKYPSKKATVTAGQLIERARRGIQPDMDRYYEERFWAMWRY